MDPRIEKLKSTTFFGRRFTRRQIADIQQTVARFPALSRKELAETICEHLNWRTAAGGNRVAAALGLLEQLEQAGILTLPPKHTQNMRPGPRPPVAATPRSAPQPLIATSLRDLQPLRLQRVEQQEDTQLWNEFIERHHYLGYRQPLGPHLRYFLLDRHGRRLGCVLFSQATHSLACRDEWVGWPAGQYKKHLDLVVGQPALLAVSLGAGSEPGESRAGAGSPAAAGGLAAALWHAAGPARNLLRNPALPGHLLPRRQLDPSRPDPGPRRRRAQPQGCVCLPADEAVPLDPAARAAPAGPATAAAGGAAAGPRRGLRRPLAGPARRAQRHRRRSRPTLASAQPRPQHAAGDAVRVPPRVRAAPPGLHHDAVPAVGPVPRPGRAPAATAAGLRRGHVQGPAAD